MSNPLTIDERLEFLLQSTESLHETVALHSSQIAENSRQIEALIHLSDRNERRWLRIMRVLRDALDAGVNGSEPEAE